MKKYIAILAVLSSTMIMAQEGNVGINTDKPTARLEIQSAGNTRDTKALRTAYGDREVFSIYDNGYLGVNTSTPEAMLDIKGTNTVNSFYIKKPTNVLINGVSGPSSLEQIRYAGGGQYSNANIGGSLFIFDVGGASVFDALGSLRGIEIRPAKAIPAGIYIGGTREIGFSLDRLPTTALDAGGNVRLRESSVAIVAGASCTNRAGEIQYYKGHFYGCHNNSWVQMDN